MYEQFDIMLDLEVVPERSLGNEQWEFVLGKLMYNSNYHAENQIIMLLFKKLIK